jgi:hypothetical protein
MAQPSGSTQKEESKHPTTGHAGEEVKHKAQEAGSSLLDKAKDVASSAGHAAGNVATAIGHKAEDATHAVGCGMESLGSTIREHAPQGGMVGTAASKVAGSLESGGRYLREEGLRGMGRDLTDLVRRNPIPSLLIGVGIGFLLARATRS